MALFTQVNNEAGKPLILKEKLKFSWFTGKQKLIMNDSHHVVFFELCDAPNHNELCDAPIHSLKGTK